MRSAELRSQVTELLTINAGNYLNSMVELVVVYNYKW